VRAESANLDIDDTSTTVELNPFEVVEITFLHNDQQVIIRPEDLVGTEGNDLLVGGEADDTVTGLAGDDTLEGQDGNDIINGDEGDDRGVGGRGNDTLDGGDGIDVLGGVCRRRHPARR